MPTDAVDPIILALAMGSIFYVEKIVDVLKRVVPDDDRREWMLPALGWFAGCLIVLGTQVFNGAVLTNPRTWAGVLLAGLLAYIFAAGGHALTKKTIEATDKKREKRAVKLRPVPPTPPAGVRPVQPTGDIGK